MNNKDLLSINHRDIQKRNNKNRKRGKKILAFNKVTKCLTKTKVKI
jgi:hypothetical protein